MSEHVPARCDNCGAVDDHPKLHYGAATYHHDCLPYDVKQAVSSNGLVTQIIAAAEDGTHGDELRSHIIALHEGN
jgi:hypothetical protein